MFIKSCKLTEFLTCSFTVAAVRISKATSPGLVLWPVFWFVCFFFFTVVFCGLFFFFFFGFSSLFLFTYHHPRPRQATLAEMQRCLSVTILFSFPLWRVFSVTSEHAEFLLCLRIFSLIVMLYFSKV